MSPGRSFGLVSYKTLYLSQHPNDWLRYKALKKQAQKTCRETHDKYTNDMLTNDNNNPKRFWNFIKSRKKDSTGVAPLKKDGLTFSDSLNKANIMGVQFCSVFTQEDTSELPDLGPSQTPSMPPIMVNIIGVQKLLTDIKPHKATGPDNIPGRLLKEAAEELAPGLAHLFQISVARSHWIGNQPSSPRSSRSEIVRLHQTTGQSPLRQSYVKSWNMSSTQASYPTLRKTASSPTASTAFVSAGRARPNSSSTSMTWPED